MVVVAHASRCTVVGENAGRHTASGVADPFAFVRDDGGAGSDFEFAGLRFDVERAAEDDGELDRKSVV